MGRSSRAIAWAVRQAARTFKSSLIWALRTLPTRQYIPSNYHDQLLASAIAPLVLEARGLDVTPAMIDRLREVGDDASADAFAIIMHDEVRHVGVGKTWFDYACGLQRLDPVSTWHRLIGTYFRGPLKPPFNITAREAAGFAAAFYQPMSERSDLFAPPTEAG